MGAAALPLAIGGMAAGTSMSVMGSYQQGKQTEKLAKQRAAIDQQNAEYARKAAVERAKIESEKGRRLLATQRAGFSASNVLMNVGSPLDIQTETMTNISKDIGFILQQGNQQSWNYLANAAYEKDYGKAAKRQATTSAWATGLQGAGSIAFMGYAGGLWGQSGNAPGTASLLNDSPAVNNWISTYG